MPVAVTLAGFAADDRSRLNTRIPIFTLIFARGGLYVGARGRSEEHTSELQSLMRISYAVFCLKKKNTKTHPINNRRQNTHPAKTTNPTYLLPSLRHNTHALDIHNKKHLITII